jgi:hypothetical protein
MSSLFLLSLAKNFLPTRGGQVRSRRVNGFLNAHTVTAAWSQHLTDGQERPVR